MNKIGEIRKMNSKKAITLLLIATMLLSITPVIVSNAIAVDNVYDEDYVILAGDVYYGDTIIVMGSGATPGRDVKVYWDGIDELLNTTKAEGNGDYEIWFDVPAALYGDHYITVENVRNGDIDTWSTPISVGSLIKLSPKSGLKDDVVTIKGYGFGDEVDVTDVTWDYGVTNVDISTTPTTPTTDDLGSWSATFKVLSATYAPYQIYAEDEDGNYAEATFTVGPSLSINKDSGPSGTVVRVTGRGFNYLNYIGNSTIEYNGVPCGVVTENAKVKSNGEFVCDIVIPDVPDLDEWEIYIMESGPVTPHVSATADFEILGHPEIELTPEYGPVGSTITVKGYNFTQISGEDVDIELEGSGSVKTVETTSSGTFTATYRIPGAAGTPDIIASQDDYNLEASSAFRVGFITVVIYPEDTVAGDKVTVTGSGFDELETCNVTIDGDLWIDEIAITAGGVISGTNWVPSMDPGTYDVVVTESTSGISITVQLTISENTYVTTTPTMAPAGYSVDIEGYNFAQDPIDSTLSFLLFNDTAEYELDVEYNGLAVGLGDDEDWDDGYFEGSFDLPDSDSIGIGSYTLNVTDGEGMWTQLTFEIVDKTVDIEPKKTVFRIGETLGFNVESSFMQEDSWIKVWDPSGNLYWQTDSFSDAVWVKVGTIMRVPYYSQVAGGNPMTFLEDAPLGTWTWKWYIEEDGDDEVLDEGAFTVDPAAADVVGEQVADLANQIDDLQQSISDVTGEFDSVKSDIASVRAIAQQAATAAQQAATAVQTVAQTANQANTAAQNAADAANAAKDAANSLTTLVYGAIGAALVAALAAIVSLMQISRRIAG